jgi:hypothetical protein
LRGIQRWLGGKSSIEDIELYDFPTINLYLVQGFSIAMFD